MRHNTTRNAIKAFGGTKKLGGTGEKDRGEDCASVCNGIVLTFFSAEDIPVYYGCPGGSRELMFSAPTGAGTRRNTRPTVCFL